MSEKTPSPLQGKNPFSCVIGEVSGETYITLTANQCTVKGCIYFSPGIGTVNEVADRIAKYIKEATKSDPWFKKYPVEMDVLYHQNFWVTGKDRPIVKAVYDPARDVSGKKTPVIGSPYCSDMGLLVNQGKVPTVIFWTRDIAYAHKTNECISIDGLMSWVKSLALSIYKWCR